MSDVIKQKPSPQDMTSLAAQSKRHLEDNPLLEALTTVIESNADYVRGVSTLIDSDLEREVLLTEIKKDITTTRQTLEKHNVVLKELSEKVTELTETLDKMETTLADTLQEKLGPLYKAANLQESGKEYNPTDKLVVTFQKVLSSKIFTMAAGIAIYVVLRFLFEGVK